MWGCSVYNVQDKYILRDIAITYCHNIYAADCGVPLVNRNVKLNYSSTLDGSVLTLTCAYEISNINLNTGITDEQTLHVTCHSNKTWIPDPVDFIKSCSPPGNYTGL